MRVTLEDVQQYYLDGQVLLIDKYLEWTSFDVVNKIRARLKYDLGLKKIKVGHAGTLDPLATGLLIVCTGKMTKRIDEFQGMYKEYTGTIELGKTTASYDAEMPVDREYPVDHISPELLDDVRRRFLGTIEQQTPIFSAVKIDGVRSYKLARQGAEVRTKTRLVNIDNFELTRVELPMVDFRVKCSKGTYIRSLAHEFGQKLDSGGYLAALRRTKIGEFTVNKAVSVDEWVSIFQSKVNSLG